MPPGQYGEERAPALGQRPLHEIDAIVRETVEDGIHGADAFRHAPLLEQLKARDALGVQSDDLPIENKIFSRQALQR